MASARAMRSAAPRADCHWPHTPASSPTGCASSKPYNIRLTPAQREKVERLGGAAWIRAQIDKARSEK